MDIYDYEEQRSRVSPETTDVVPSPNRPPPPPPTSPPVPPVIPSSPCRPPSPDARRPPPTMAWKDEISRGIQKLLSWRMCSERDDTVWIASNRHTSPVLQKGPECGIAALCMAVNMLEPASADKRHIMNTAQEKGYSIQGEMFSASNLLELASSSCGVGGRVLAGNMRENMDAILLHLANGWPALVPYDKDCNSEPCCLRGHKAHWAVISGFLLQCSRADLADLNVDGMHQDPAVSNPLYCVGVDSQDERPPSSERAARTAEAVLRRPRASDTYLLARQGQSGHAQPWRFSALADSNANLRELGDGVRAAPGKFVIPEGGIQAGLCSQVVLIRP